MLVPDERKLYTKRFPRPDEVREARIIEAMEKIVRGLGPDGCVGVLIENLFKDDVIRRLNYAGWEVKPKDNGLYEISPKETK